MKASRTDRQDCAARKSETRKQAEPTGRIVRPGSQKHENKPNQRVGLFGPEVKNMKTSRTKGRDCSARKSETGKQADPLASKSTRRRENRPNQRGSRPAGAKTGPTSAEVDPPARKPTRRRANQPRRRQTSHRRRAIRPAGAKQATAPSEGIKIVPGTGRLSRHIKVNS